MSRLQHPNCVSVIDFGVDGTPYLVMEFVTGQTVRKALEGAGIVFLSSGRGEGVMLVRRESRQPDEEA